MNLTQLIFAQQIETHDREFGCSHCKKRREEGDELADMLGDDEGLTEGVNDEDGLTEGVDDDEGLAVASDEDEEVTDAAEEDEGEGLGSTD